MTPGMRSTEFAITAGAFLSAAITLACGLALGRDAVAIAGLAAQAVVAIGYAHGRSKTKAPRPYLSPPEKI